MSDGPPGERRDVVRLQSMRQHLKSIDNAHGGGTALPMVWGYVRQEVIPILYGGRYSPSRSLRDPVAQFYCGIGWAAYDADQQELATNTSPARCGPPAPSVIASSAPESWPR
jgi:hypothetical protein